MFLKVAVVLAVADEELLPAIKDLQIYGEAFPGNQIKACGYSINGTAACNFAVIC